MEAKQLQSDATSTRQAFSRLKTVNRKCLKSSAQIPDQAVAPALKVANYTISATPEPHHMFHNKEHTGSTRSAQQAQSLGSLAARQPAITIARCLSLKRDRTVSSFNPAKGRARRNIRQVHSSLITLQNPTNEVTWATNDPARRTKQHAVCIEATSATHLDLTHTILETIDCTKRADVTVSKAKRDDENAGTGFAVLASEVLTRAHGSTDVVKTIVSLFGRSGDQVQNGVTLVETTSDVLTQMGQPMSGIVKSLRIEG